jgi:Sec-independent protein translocase protein TatA
MKWTIAVGLVLCLTGCSKISSVINQGKQAADAAKQAQQAAKQISQVKTTDDVQKFMRDQQAAEQAREQAEVPQPAAESADVDVQRKDKSSPEIRGFVPHFVITGQTTQLTMTGHDFRSNDQITAEGICHIKDVKINSSKQVQMTISVDDVDEGKCKLIVSAPPNRYENNVDVQLNPVGAQRQLAKMQQQMNDANAHIAQVIGKTWDVKLPSGKSDTWTKTEAGMMGITEFKDAGGKKFSIMVGKDDAVTIMMDSCMLNGKIDGNKLVNGQSVLPGCPAGTGAWSATINR